jgi:hypothetical protein
MDMHLAITRQELARRQAQLADLQRYLATQEQDFHALHGQVRAFMERYRERLGDLYLELDALESQLHTALSYLHAALVRNGIAARQPLPPKATALPLLAQLPAAAPLPPQPQGGLQDLAPPSLKQLYRRAAMRLHPDLANTPAQRLRREQQMMTVNAAYAAGDRPQLEALLLAAGEEAIKITGNNSLAILEWLRSSELAVQGRTRVVQAHLVALQANPMHQLWKAVATAELKGLDPLGVMANRLRTQIAERRQELYIGQRLQPESDLAQDFLHQRVLRMGATAA